MHGVPSRAFVAHHGKPAPVGEEKLESGAVEANSGLGRALRYFNRHYDRLTAFCHHEGARLDNNVMEQHLKLIARNRKNAHYFKTAAGAAIGDVITSIIATCASAGVNVLEYLNAIQSHQDAVKASPSQWLPWTYPHNTAA